MRAVELFVNLWIYGVPVAVIVWAVLRLASSAPARLRYGIAVAGFVATMVPWWSFSRPASGATGGGGSAVVIPDPVAKGLVIAWLAIAVVLLLRDAIGHVRLRRARLALPGAPEELKRALDWPACVPLVVSEGGTPFTAGLLKPAVVLPRDLAEHFSMNVVQRIARHELSHARWRDPLVYAALRVAGAVFWLAPAWIVLRWVRREREAAADAFALRDAAGAEESYVAALVRLARPSRELAPAMAASDLEYRARRILARPRVPAVAAIALAFGGSLLAVAAPARFGSDEPVVVRERAVVVDRPVPRVEVRAVPSKEPRRARPKHAPRTVEERVEERVEEQLLPVSRGIASLTLPEPSPPVTVNERVDVARHVDVNRHVAVDDRDGDDRRIRIVIRN